MSNFPSTVVNQSKMIFEKSATYFTHSLAPERIRVLLPDVKLVVILADPIKRAYSWYQVHVLYCIAGIFLQCIILVNFSIDCRFGKIKFSNGHLFIEKWQKIHILDINFHGYNFYHNSQNVSLPNKPAIR